MRPECLEFSTKDCLEMVKEVNPTAWLLDISKPVQQMLKYRRLHKITYSQAMDAIIAVKPNMADKICTMAAFQFIMSEKVKMYKETVDQINAINQQQLYAQESKLTSASEKASLKDYYQDKLQALEEKRKDLLKSPEVCKAIQVQYNTAATRSNSNRL